MRFHKECGRWIDISERLFRDHLDFDCEWHSSISIYNIILYYIYYSDIQTRIIDFTRIKGASRVRIKNKCFIWTNFTVSLYRKRTIWLRKNIFHFYLLYGYLVRSSFKIILIWIKKTKVLSKEKKSFSFKNFTNLTKHFIIFK